MSIVLGTGDLMVRKTDNITVDEINKDVQHLAHRSLFPPQKKYGGPPPFPGACPGSESPSVKLKPLDLT